MQFGNYKQGEYLHFTILVKVIKAFSMVMENFWAKVLDSRCKKGEVCRLLPLLPYRSFLPLRHGPLTLSNAPSHLFAISMHLEAPSSDLLTSPQPAQASDLPDVPVWGEFPHPPLAGTTRRKMAQPSGRDAPRNWSMHSATCPGCSSCGKCPLPACLSTLASGNPVRNLSKYPGGSTGYFSASRSKAGLQR